MNQNADKRSRRIVYTGSGRSKFSLGGYVIIDAQSVGNKSKKKRRQNITDAAFDFIQAERDEKGPGARTESFDHNNLKRVFDRQHSGAVSFRLPSRGRQQ